MSLELGKACLLHSFFFMLEMGFSIPDQFVEDSLCQLALRWVLQSGVQFVDVLDDLFVFSVQRRRGGYVLERRADNLDLSRYVLSAGLRILADLFGICKLLVCFRI